MHSPAESSVLGIDIGAGSLKTTVVDGLGRERGSASRDFSTRTPQPGWSEQDPQDWWQALCDTVPRALADAGLPASSVRAVAFSAGAHTPVLTDAQHRVLRPAILWNDQRSGAEAAELQQAHGARILSVALNRPTPTWTLPQLRWLRRHEPQVADAVRHVYVAKDWLRAQLTGDWHTDVTDAVGTLLWDHAGHRWSPELCAMAGWDVSTLPPVVAPTDVVGAVTEAASRACGLPAGTPVVCGTSDTSCESYGAGSDAPGCGVVKLATAGTVSIVGDQPRVHPTLINYPFAIPGLWYTITGTNGCASAHRWLRDRFFARPGDSGSAVFAEMDRLAAQAPAGADGLLFHPYLQGERAPYWDPLLRADFVGMTLRHEPGHFVRALYEGIALSLRDVLGEFRAQGLDMVEARIVGGGARSATWRQVVADALGVRIVLPAVTDASFGAALLAGVACGFFEDERSAARHGQGSRAVHEPDPARRALYDDLFGLYKETQQALAGINHRLHDFARSAAAGA
ncbi:xylulokinase [Aquincola sp. MAHUQ-54]|uniref:Xylulokinase n=1 Tax=Aquincola agrisoli TaxID=3119538 RepID=A0AAW9QMB7_9BURK